MPQHDQPTLKPQAANGRAIRTVSCLIAAACALAIGWPTPSARAESSGGTYVMRRFVIANGGQHASGGTYVAESTIGESTASNAATGGTFSLRGGFQQPAAEAPGNALFCDSFENTTCP